MESPRRLTFVPNFDEPQYLGCSTGEGSATGQKVVKRMKDEGKIDTLGTGGTKRVLGPDGEWYNIKQTDIGHVYDVVSWWNTEGRKHGPKSKEVREWLLDSE